MPDSPISIGAIDLQDFEIPSCVRFGGRQRLAVHKLSGGGRIVETLGPDEDEISFRGTASGPDAGTRVQAINRLRLSGEAVWLTWSSFRYRVVVKNLTIEYQSPWWVPFRVRCIVVDQEGANGPNGISLWASISADLSRAVSLAGPDLGLAALQTALANNNVASPGAFNQAQASSSVAAALVPIQLRIARDSDVLTASGEHAPNPAGYGSHVAATVACAGSLATAVNTLAYVKRVGSVLGNFN